jgi:serine/threonine protein kinase
MNETTFGKYSLIAELGSGGMADVFLAVAEGPVGSRFRKLTVIKRLRRSFEEDPEFVTMLVEEARIAARLNHPNVVQTLEVGQIGKSYFIAMEYLDGQPVHRIQVRGAAKGYPRELQYLIVCDALAGLHHAHGLKDYDGSPLEVVHRDVSPHNLFVTYEGQVKVMDFGIAKAAGRAIDTSQGLLKGKVRYMGPEQALAISVDQRADLFAVGIMIWEIATGKRLWRDMDDMAVVNALVAGEVPRSPKAAAPSAEVPDGIDAICRKALARDLTDRYLTAEELRTDLELYLADSGTLVGARRKLGPFVAELFAEERKRMTTVIESQLTRLSDAASAESFRTIFIPLDSSSTPTPSAQTLQGKVEVSAFKSEAETISATAAYLHAKGQVPRVAPPEPGLERRGRYLGGALATLALLGGAVALLSHRPTHDAGTSALSDPYARQTPVASAPVPPVPESAPTPPPAVTDLEATSEPVTAALDAGTDDAKDAAIASAATALKAPSTAAPKGSKRQSGPDEFSGFGGRK